MNQRIETLIFRAAKLAFVLFPVPCSLFPFSASAATITWAAAGSGNWNQGSNWSTGTVPGPSDDVFISTNGTYTVVIDNINPTIKSLTLGAISGRQTLFVNERTITLTGDLTVGANGELNLKNATITLTNVGDQLINGGELVVRGPCRIDGSGNIDNQSGGLINIVTGNSTFASTELTVTNGIENAGRIELTCESGNRTAQLTVPSGIVTNTGIIDVLHGAAADGGGPRILNLRLHNSGEFNISQPLTFNGTNAPDAHVNSNGTINVNANLTWNLTGDTLANNGGGQITIAAGQTLTLNKGTFNYNAGTLGGPGTLSLSGDATTGHTTNLSVPFSNEETTLLLRSSTVNGPDTVMLTNVSRLELIDSRINVPFNNNALLLVRGGCTIGSPAGTFVTNEDSTIRISGDSGTFGSASLTVSNGFTNPGDIELTSTNGLRDSALTVNGGVLTNTGTISVLPGEGGNRTLTFELNNQGDLNIGTNGTINGRSSATDAHVNTGDINVSGGNLSWDLAGDTFQNNGTITIAADRTLVLGGGSFTNFGSQTLTGGTHHVAGTLRFSNASIVTNAATIILDGPNAAIQDAAGGDALADFATNAAAGALTLKNGRTLATSGAVSNSGTITLEGGTLDPNNLLDIQAGGMLRGNGSVLGNVTNAGAFEAGLSPGSISITGDYTQTAAGTLKAEIGGLIAGAMGFDQLLVGGTASLAGTLNASLFGDEFEPSVGDTFDIITAGAVSGTFGTQDLPPSLGETCNGGVEYGPTFVRIHPCEVAVDWDTLDCGGTTLITGGSFAIAATFGQADTGPVAGGDFVMTLGFWPLPAQIPPAPGDFDGDGDVDSDDFALFLPCLEGPDAGPPFPGCEEFDLDSSGDVDLLDFAEFQTLVAPPG